MHIIAVISTVLHMTEWFLQVVDDGASPTVVQSATIDGYIQRGMRKRCCVHLPFKNEPCVKSTTLAIHVWQLPLESTTGFICTPLPKSISGTLLFYPLILSVSTSDATMAIKSVLTLLTDAASESASKPGADYERPFESFSDDERQHHTYWRNLMFQLWSSTQAVDEEQNLGIESKGPFKADLKKNQKHVRRPEMKHKKLPRNTTVGHMSKKSKTSCDVGEDKAAVEVEAKDMTKTKEKAKTKDKAKAKTKANTKHKGKNKSENENGTDSSRILEIINSLDESADDNEEDDSELSESSESEHSISSDEDFFVSDNNESDDLDLISDEESDMTDDIHQNDEDEMESDSDDGDEIFDI